MVNGLAATNAMDLFQPAEKAHRYETRSNIDGNFKITKTRTKKADTACYHNMNGIDALDY